MQEMVTTSESLVLSTIKDSAIMKEVQATHAPDGREVDVRPILNIIEDIFRRATLTTDGGTLERMDTLEDSTSLAALSGMPEVLSCIHKISCEISCKCSGGGDAHATTVALFNTLSNYPWDVKMMLSLAAFAVNYGEFCLSAQLCINNNPLAKYVAVLKQLPNVSQIDKLNNKLIKAMLDISKCIFEFKQKLNLSTDRQIISTAMANIRKAAYWTIRSVVACTSQITGLRNEYASSTETWELLVHKVSSIHKQLNKQIDQLLEEKKQIEAYHNLVLLFETSHQDNIKALKALISTKDDIQPLVIGSTKVNIDVLKGKHVLLLISSLDLSSESEEISVLKETYETRQEDQYEIVWLPIVDRSIDLNECQQKFEQLRAMMPWYTVQHPTMIEPAVIRYIKVEWQFSKKTILVTLDHQGSVLNKDAFHILRIWRNSAFPFTVERETELWKTTSWSLELLIDGLDVKILEWIKEESQVKEEKILCLYGGEDIDWIERFTKSAKSVASTAQINLGMAYVGKKYAKDKIEKISSSVHEKNLTLTRTDIKAMRSFWGRLESMLYSQLQLQLQHGKYGETSRIMQDIMTILSFDGSDQGWAIFWKGKTHEMARVKGDTAVHCMVKFEEWKDDAYQNGFVQGLNNYLHKIPTPHHCIRLTLPGILGAIPETIVCAECGRTMEKNFMYRCCVD